MRNMTQAERTRLRDALVGNGLLLLFGCGVLAFLVAVDRLDWFAIRPATGTSIAMARSTEAAARHAADQARRPEIALPR
ncbi:hypothetical protein [Novosphingobium soli]|uniref:Uncharacterized protein n=1 Tax=Novosphingobium soli TaxID=574956 RepID=A0ABV6CS54_9SPHN